jgi:hypothetical protein
LGANLGDYSLAGDTDISFRTFSTPTAIANFSFSIPSPVIVEIGYSFSFLRVAPPCLLKHGRLSFNNKLAY